MMMVISLTKTSVLFCYDHFFDQPCVGIANKLYDWYKKPCLARPKNGRQKGY